jgi:predicted restriction endonuclease
MPSNKGTSRSKRKQTSPDHCEICGYDKLVQRHRIVPGREKGRYELGNVISLCPNHHSEADRGLLRRDELHTIVQDRIASDKS